MGLLKRFSYYSVGLIFGGAISLFFLKKKNMQFDYFPNDRILKSIRVKDRSYSDDAFAYMSLNKIDTADISSLLMDGDAEFLRNMSLQDTCKYYNISGQIKERNITILIKRCDSFARIELLELENENR